MRGPQFDRSRFQKYADFTNIVRNFAVSTAEIICFNWVNRFFFLFEMAIFPPRYALFFVKVVRKTLNG